MEKAPNVVWRYRTMFGGIGVYANDRMCVSLSDVGLAIKLVGAEREALLNTSRPNRPARPMSLCRTP
jgi:TfoX/Sxy family transcriptional regulator of competence genes